MKEYVVGFLFNHDLDKVVLIAKQKPDWQKGFLNGVGGRIEKGETSQQTMVREFKEEAGLEILSWENICDMQALDCRIYFFKNMLVEGIDLEMVISSQTEEQVRIYRVVDLPYLKTIPNLKWLIPMCLDSDHKYCIAKTNNSMKK